MTDTTITSITIADFIADRLAESDKTQREIAAECGFETPNIITMFKKGSTKVPLNRIGVLAKSLDADPAHMLRLAMREYMPDTWESIEDTLHSTLLTANELKLVRAYREATGNADPEALVINRDSVIAVVAA